MLASALKQHLGHEVITRSVILQFAPLLTDISQLSQLFGVTANIDSCLIQVSEVAHDVGQNRAFQPWGEAKLPCTLSCISTFPCGSRVGVEWKEERLVVLLPEIPADRAHHCCGNVKCYTVVEEAGTDNQLFFFAQPCNIRKVIYSSYINQKYLSTLQAYCEEKRTQVCDYLFIQFSKGFDRFVWFWVQNIQCCNAVLASQLKIAVIECI